MSVREEFEFQRPAYRENFHNFPFCSGIMGPTVEKVKNKGQVQTDKGQKKIVEEFSSDADNVGAEDDRSGGRSGDESRVETCFNPVYSDPSRIAALERQQRKPSPIYKGSRCQANKRVTF